MKKYLLIGLTTLSTLILISWGYVGHKITATIAENHLTPNAKAAIKELLGDQSIADIASWADDVRNTPEYKATAPWHFLNVELGMNFDQFSKTVKSLPGENIYTAIYKCEADLQSPTTTREQKIIALKFLVHFIGDAHQPMHISRAEDKGGNTIQVQFMGKGTNLHSLWDSGLLNHQGLDDKALVSKLESQIKLSGLPGYNKDDVMHWLFDSYKISSTLYNEVEKNNQLDEDYYKSHIQIVNDRLIAGGLHLAGLLNFIFKEPIKSGVSKTVVSDVTVSASAKNIDVKDAANHIGELVSITTIAFSAKDMGSMVLVNLGAEYPNQLLTVVLRGNAKVLGKDLEGKTVLVTGKLEDYKGKPEIVVNDIANFKIVPMVGHGGTRGGE